MAPAKRSLPLIAHLDPLRREAKLRLVALKQVRPQTRLAEAQAALARDYGFASWAALKAEAQRRSSSLPRGQRRDLAALALNRQSLAADFTPDTHSFFFRAGLAAQFGFVIAALVGLGLVLLAGQAHADAPLDRYVGSYQMTPRAVAHIGLDNGRLTVRLTGQPARPLEQKTPGDFFVTGLPAEIVFTETQGGVTALTIHQGGRDIAAPRVTEAAAAAIEAAPKGHPMARTWPQMTGVKVRTITQEAEALDYWPVFSPDGATVLFSRSRDGGRTWTLLRVNADGGAVQVQPGLPPGSATRADWSAKTGRIAFTNGDGGKSSLWVMDGDGETAKAVGGSEGLLYPSWYPDGESLAAMDGARLVTRRLMLADGKSTDLTDRTRVLTGMPSVSPNGQIVAFAGQANTGNPYDQEENVIWLRNADGSLATLETPPMQGRAPVWSPDGRRVAFESDRGNPDGAYAVFIANADGTGLTQVTDFTLNATHPVFSPDGRHLVMAVGSPAQHVSNIAVADLP